MPRRDFLKRAGASLAGSAIAGTGLLSAVGCGGGGGTSGGNTASNGGDPWKRFSGTTIQFISENTPPTSAISANLQEFKNKTGINVEIAQMNLDALVEQVALDFGAGQGQYNAIYTDCYQVLAPYHQGLVDLNTFENDDSLPSIPKGVEDFIPAQLAAAGRFGDEETLYALPYDCPTMIWFYRRDLFDKYRDQMQQDLGFDPTPSDASTWQQYYQTAQWFNDNASEVPYGTGHQAQQHDSLQCDFSNVLWAFGGDYFQNGREIGRLGTENPGPCMLDQPKAIQAAEFYNRLLSIAHPGSTTWDWTGVAEAFAGGEIAMTANWHEFAASAEEGLSETGEVGYARLPKGPTRSANHYGGAGLGINSGASEEVQKATWLFLVWATSPQTQRKGLFAEQGGGTPTRQSVYDMQAVQQAKSRPSEAPNMLSADAVNKAWQPENVGFRPKIPSWNECDTAIYTELSNMLAGNKSPQQAMRSAKQKFDDATGASSA